MGTQFRKYTHLVRCDMVISADEQGHCFRLVAEFAGWTYEGVEHIDRRGGMDAALAAYVEAREQLERTLEDDGVVARLVLIGVDDDTRKFDTKQFV